MRHEPTSGGQRSPAPPPSRVPAEVGMWQQRKDNWHAQVTYQQYLAKNPSAIGAARTLGSSSPQSDQPPLRPGPVTVGRGTRFVRNQSCAPTGYPTSRGTSGHSLPYLRTAGSKPADLRRSLMSGNGRLLLPRRGSAPAPRALDGFRPLRCAPSEGRREGGAQGVCRSWYVEPSDQLSVRDRKNSCTSRSCCSVVARDSSSVRSPIVSFTDAPESLPR
jgi:hypothetical protein